VSGTPEINVFPVSRTPEISGYPESQMRLPGILDTGESSKGVVILKDIFFFFKYSRSIWVPKNAEFYADSKSVYKIEKKCTKNDIVKKLLFC